MTFLPVLISVTWGMSWRDTAYYGTKRYCGIKQQLRGLLFYLSSFQIIIGVGDEWNYFMM